MFTWAFLTTAMQWSSHLDLWRQCHCLRMVDGTAGEVRINAPLDRSAKDFKQEAAVAVNLVGCWVSDLWNWLGQDPNWDAVSPGGIHGPIVFTVYKKGPVSQFCILWIRWISQLNSSSWQMWGSLVLHLPQHEPTNGSHRKMCRTSSLRTLD